MEYVFALLSLVLNLLLISQSLGEASHHDDPDNAGSRFINEWAVLMDGSLSDVKAAARQMGFIYLRSIPGLAGYHIFRRPERMTEFSPLHHRRLRRNNLVKWAEQQQAKVRKKRSLRFNDPMFKDMWYLNKGAHGGYDMNVQAAWDMGYSGKGVVVTILDDGIEYTHPDLKKNYDSRASSDINDNDDDPMPRQTFSNENKHGTRCAGEVAAAANNKVCSVGVAYNARIGGVRMLDGDITDTVEGRSLSLNQDHIDIYSGSWGPDDNGKVVDGPGTMARRAFETGVTTGRGGLGNIFVWASGNGGSNDDSCACDGYAGSIYTLSVSSVSEDNKKPWYLEKCASTLASTYSSGYSPERQIVTTDLHGLCTKKHTGTSASAPLAAGIVALVLEANRNLTWRDVQYLTLITANPKPFVDGNWITNGVGRKVSLLYGFGLMDAGKMVYLAQIWRRTPKQRRCTVGPVNFNKKIYGKGKTTVSFSTDGCQTAGSQGAKVSYLEHILLYLNLVYTKRGDLQIALTSPSGTRSVLLPRRLGDTVSGSTKFERWPLMSVQFWGENPVGTWTLEVENTGANFNSGHLTSGTLVLHGVSQHPLRLRPPPASSARPDWFVKEFQHYVMTDKEYRANRTIDTGDTSKENPENRNIKCHKECINTTACTGPGPQHCTACLHFRVNSTSACVAGCPPGTYALAKQRVCKTCDESCASCSGPGDHSCSSCVVGRALLPTEGRCLAVGETCPRGTYLTVRRICQPCTKPCEACQSAEKCLKCNSSWVLSPTGQCVTNCPTGHYVSANRHCLPCAPVCPTCVTGRDDGCLTCSTTKRLLKTNRTDIAGACVDMCPSGFYLDSSANMCYRCHEACSTCHGGIEKDCTECRKPLVLHEGICVDPADLKCKNDEFKNASGCFTCHSSCLRCDEGGSNRCLECRHPSNVFQHGSCLTACPDGTVVHNYTDADSVRGSVPSCVPCHPLCAACHAPGPGKCSRCQPGLQLAANGVCRTHCKVGKYAADRGSCRSCNDRGCAICTGANHCLMCRRGWVLNNGGCKVGHSCPEGHGALDDTCVPCPDPECAGCGGSELRNCTTCRKGFRPNSQGKCHPIPVCHSKEFHDSINGCQPCHSLCRTCSGPGSDACLSCRREACLIDGVCQPCCSSTPAGYNGGLVSPYGCANCSLGSEPTCLVAADSPDVTSDGGISNFSLPVRMFVSLAFSICLVLPVLFLFIFCVLQLRSGELSWLPCCRAQSNRRPDGPDYTPLSTNPNGSPEKSATVFVDHEMTPKGTTSNGFVSRDSEDSSGVGSSPDKSPDRSETA